MKKYIEFISEQVNWNRRLIDFAACGDLKGVKLALKNGANINADDDYALRLVVVNGHLEIFKYLVGQGANIHFENDYALRIASQNGHLKIIKYTCEWIIQKEPWYIPKILKYIPDELKEKYAYLFAASDMDLL